MTNTPITDQMCTAAGEAVEQAGKSPNVRDVVLLQVTGGLWRVFYQGRCARRTFQSADQANAWIISISERA